MWEPLKLKLEETSYFAGQLAGVTRHPKIFLFHLCAFLTSARSVTAHLQAQFDVASKQPYTGLRDELLGDGESRFFKNTRDASAHTGYPPLVVTQVIAQRTEDGQVARKILNSGPITNARDLAYIDHLLATDWERHSIAEPPVQIDYYWFFSGFPGFPHDDKDVPQACRAHADKLWHFVFRFREAWERELNKEELARLLEPSFRWWYE